MSAISPRRAASSTALTQPFELRPAARASTPALATPRLTLPGAPILALRDVAPRRTKIWEFNTNLHCSIIGTCLSTAELRSVLRRMGKAPEGSTDHELHHIAVSLAARHDEPAKRLQKALDHAHRLAVSQFARAGTEQAVRSLWQESVRRGEIPGAYWATLTHEATTQALIREAFGEVHMLSHLVGAANRADIRRLCALESEKAALLERLDQLQTVLHEAVQSRDRQINALRADLDARPPATAPLDGERAALRAQAAELQRRLDAETGRRAAVEDRLQALQAALARERHDRLLAEEAAAALRQELKAAEASFGLTRPDPSEPADGPLDGRTLLYVGGRPNQITPMRSVIERMGGTFLHHDGGIEHHAALLPGLTHRADIVVFPVDCISHEAANAVKALCRQGDKRYVPLRTASITALLAALRQPPVEAA